MSQTTFTRYHPDTGKIHSKANCHVSDYLANVGLYPSLAVVDQDCDLDADYVDLTAEPIVRRRPTVPGFDKLALSADGVDAAILSLPVPFVITVDGVPHAVDTPDDAGLYAVTIDSAMPATYAVTVEAWPYQPYTAEIVAS